MLHHTTVGDHTAVWHIANGPHQIEIEQVISHADSAPAYRMRMDGSRVAIPNADPGIVLLGEGDKRPDLPQLREWFPGLYALWDAVRAHYWDVVSPMDRPRYSGPTQSARNHASRSKTYTKWAIGRAPMKFRPTAVGYCRSDVSGLQQAWDEQQIRSTATHMGYDLAKIVVVDGRTNPRPLAGLKATITRIHAEAVFAPSLAHFLNNDVPSDLVQSVDLITVDPENTYTRLSATS